MKNIYVFSEAGIEDYYLTQNTVPAILISIYSRYGRPAEVMPSEKGIQDILFLKFDDEDNERGISKEDAESIQKFLLKYPDIKNIFVNCEAGQSRSAGVAGALMLYFNKDDSPIFSCPKYTPNMRCYRFVLNQLMQPV